MTNINRIYNIIKFTHEINPNELTLLDITLYKGIRFNETNTLDILTHIKPTNKQIYYIHATSYHPQSIIAVIIKGETKQYLHTNSDKENFKTMTLKLTHRLKERGYKQSNT